MHFILQAAATTSTTTASGVPTAAGPVIVAAEVAIVIAGIALFGTILSYLVTGIARRAGASKSVVGSVRQWVVVFMILVAIAAVASLTGISSEFTTLTLSGIAGLAVSLALQSTLSNVIAGVLLLQDGFLRLGDDLEFGSVRGEVIKLSLRTTWVKTKEGVIVVIGNGNLTAGPIVNRTAAARLQKKVQV